MEQPEYHVLEIDALTEAHARALVCQGATIRIERNVSSLVQPNECRLVLSSQSPPRDAITSVLALAFEDSRFLMTDLVRRGWDIPGGHVEPGERPEATVRREVYEETGAILGDLEPLGYQAIRILGAVPSEYRYPIPDSYQVFYLAHVVALDAFVSTSETRGRALLPPSGARTTGWVQKNRELYEVALTLATSGGQSRLAPAHQ